MIENIKDTSVLEEVQKQKASIKHKDSNIVFNKVNWKIKQESRSKDRMKLVIKLSKEEAEAVDAFKKVVIPEGKNSLKDEDFLKMVFFMGVEALNERLNQSFISHMENNREEFEAKGVSFDENGKFKAAPRKVENLLKLPEVLTPEEATKKAE